MRTASTRLIWPAPTPMVARSAAMTIAFERTCLHTRQAKTRSPHCCSSGAPATTVQPSRSSISASASCTSTPPSTRFSPRCCALGRRRSRSTRMRVPCFRPSASSAASAYPGANRTSTNCAASFSPSAASTSRLSTTMPPYADTGSEARALSYASSIVAPSATPHGFACFTMTHAGSANSRQIRRAAERSLRLLKEMALPCSCSTRDSRCARPPRSA